MALSSDLARGVTEAWEAVLGVGSAADPNRDFFAIGGDSLRVVEFWTAVEAIHPGEIDVDGFFRKPTLANMLALLAADDPAGDGAEAMPASADAVPAADRRGRQSGWLDSWPGEGPSGSRTVVSFNAGSLNAPPIFLVCQGLEEAENFARAMGPDRAVHAFRSGTHVKLPKSFNARDLAHVYLDHIDELHPTGPVLLVGFCQGGVTAREIAVEMRARGRSAPFLALLEWHFGGIEYRDPSALLYASEGVFCGYYKNRFLLPQPLPANVDVLVLRADHNLLNDSRRTAPVLAELIERFLAGPAIVGSDLADDVAGDGLASSGIGDADIGACVAPDALIRVARRGVVEDVPAETVASGDLLVTASGAHRPIRSIEHRTATGPRAPGLACSLRIAAHAIAPGVPSRDVRVLPDQAIEVDRGMLVPAGTLVNGATVREDIADAFTYLRIELASHDSLLVDGLACESGALNDARSFIAGPDRTAIEGVLDVADASRSYATSPLAFHGDGSLLDESHARVLARARAAGWTLEGDATGDMHLLVDGTRVEAEMQGLTAVFPVPATASEVRLRSSGATPRQLGINADGRRLGVCLAGLRIEDELRDRTFDLGDPRLSHGFHALEEGVRRWTTGDALLPSALWDGWQGVLRLRVDLAAPCLPGWVMPSAR